jgi:hypothetical protein
LVTIFSAPRYCGMDNHGVILDVFNEKDVRLKVVLFVVLILFCILLLFIVSVFLFYFFPLGLRWARIIILSSQFSELIC